MQQQQNNYYFNVFRYFFLHYFISFFHLNISISNHPIHPQPSITGMGVVNEGLINGRGTYLIWMKDDRFGRSYFLSHETIVVANWVDGLLVFDIVQLDCLIRSTGDKEKEREGNLFFLHLIYSPFTHTHTETHSYTYQASNGTEWCIVQTLDPVIVLKLCVDFVNLGSHTRTSPCALQESTKITITDSVH